MKFPHHGAGLKKGAAGIGVLPDQGVGRLLITMRRVGNDAGEDQDLKAEQGGDSAQTSGDV